MPRLAVALLLLSGILAGCHPEKNDSHTEVFKTADQLSADRHKQLLQSHQQLAISLLHFSRPDLQASVAATGIDVQEDGFEKQIDLLPIEDQLMHQANQERPILRNYLEQQLRPFDQERLAALGFEKVRSAVRYVLLNGSDLDQMQKEYGQSPICSGLVVPNLFRAAVVPSGGVDVPVNQAMLMAWHVRDADVDSAAQASLRQMISQARNNLFDTINYPTFGNCGTLKVDGSVVLAPEFLKAVRQQWKTQDDLVVFIPSTHSVQFVAKHSEKLLGLLNPQWQKVVASLADPLYRLLLVRNTETLSAFVFAPATKPVATQPATKPEIFIVN